MKTTSEVRAALRQAVQSPPAAASQELLSVGAVVAGLLDDVEELIKENRMLQDFVDQTVGQMPAIYTEGAINDEDEGELNLQIAPDPENKVVVVRFAKPTNWLAMGPEDALVFIGLISTAVSKLRG